MIKILVSCFLICFANTTFAASTSPEGQWHTIDDESGEVKSLVTIWTENGELMGKIETLFNPSEPNPSCIECKGSHKDQPIEGMTFVWGLEQDGDEWKGGSILDPANGKVYKAKLKVAEDGESLEVRGFIGFALIGRTQTWQRVQ